MECMSMRNDKYESGNVWVWDMINMRAGMWNYETAEIQIWEIGIMRIMRVGGMRIGAM